MSRRGSARRRSADELVTIYWRDIPAQVTATVGGTKAAWLLDERFQVAIDRAATVAGLTATDDYVREWRREATPCSAEPETAAQARAAELESMYDRDRVQLLIQHGGLDQRPRSST